MRKGIILSLLLGMSCLYAGGNITPVEEPIIVVVPEEVDNSAFYIGLGYGMLNQLNENVKVGAVSFANSEYLLHTVMAQVGYKYNEYIGIEGRYWYGVSDLTQTQSGVDVDKTGTYMAMGIYLKPSYPIMDGLDIYGLLGYSAVTLDMDDGSKWDTDGISFGVGASYDITEDISLFADYLVVAYTDAFDTETVPGTADINVNTINVGVSYKF